MNSVRIITAFALAVLFFGIPDYTEAQALCRQLSGSIIIGQDNDSTALGQVSSRFRTDSIFNSNGRHGGRFSRVSVWNTNSPFGSRFSAYSAMNPNALKPPLIVKNGRVIGHLSVNSRLRGAVNPYTLKGECGEMP